MKSIRIAMLALVVLAAAPAAAQTLNPAASATIRRLPELGIFDVAPVSSVQSTYSRTSQVNREFRRGIAEFAIPNGPILGATLVLAESRGMIAQPTPPDLHHLTAYGSADLAVTTDDYDRAGTEVASFSTDANDEPQTFTFDVTALVSAAAGGTLGFRVQLDVDPTNVAFVPLGSSFEVHLEIAQPTPVSRSSWGAVKTAYR